MSYSNRGRHARPRDGRRLHAALKCCWKGNLLLLTPTNDAPPNSLKNSNANPKVEIMEKKKLGYIP